MHVVNHHGRALIDNPKRIAADPIERSDDYAFANDLVTFRVISRVGAAQIDTDAYRVLTMAA
jgi:hypothetical protein